MGLLSWLFGRGKTHTVETPSEQNLSRYYVLGSPEHGATISDCHCILLYSDSEWGFVLNRDLEQVPDDSDIVIAVIERSDALQIDSNFYMTVYGWLLRGEQLESLDNEAAAVVDDVIEFPHALRGEEIPVGRTISDEELEMLQLPTNIRQKISS